MKAGILISSALALSTPAAFAQSSLTLYGIVDSSISYISNANGASRVFNQHGMAGPRFGFKGSEAISPTTQAIFVLEQGFESSTGAASSSALMFQRRAFVGLKDRDYGTVTMGRQYSSYYQFVGPLSASSQFSGTNGAQPGDINSLDTTIRINRSIVYETPEFAGLKASLTYGFGGQAGSLSAGNAFSAALRYARGPLIAAAGYLKIRNTENVAGAWDSASSSSFMVSSLNTGFQSARAIQMFAAGATYAFPHITVGITAANTEYLPGKQSLFTDTAVFNTIGTTFRYRIKTNIDLAGGYDYVHASRSNGMSEGAQYHQVALIEIYHFSKMVSVYLGGAFQHASGQTLNVSGQVVDATAAIGDGATVSTPSSSGNQLFGMAGMRYDF